LRRLPYAPGAVERRWQHQRIGAFASLPGANTAVPTANQDRAQFEFTKKFLQDKQLTVDIFAISPAGTKASAPVRTEMGKTELRRPSPSAKNLMSHCRKAQPGEVRLSPPPIDRTDAAVRRRR